MPPKARPTKPAWRCTYIAGKPGVSCPLFDFSDQTIDHPRIEEANYSIHVFPYAFHPAGQIPGFIHYYNFTVPPIVHLHSDTEHIGTFDLSLMPEFATRGSMSFRELVLFLGQFMLNELDLGMYEEDLDESTKRKVCQAFKRRILNRENVADDTPSRDWEDFMNKRLGRGSSFPRLLDLFLGMHWVWAFEDWHDFGVFRVKTV